MRRVVAALLLLLQVAGCKTAPRAVDRPADYISTQQPKEVVLRRTDGSELRVDAPRMYGDTLLGYTPTDTGAAVVWLGMSDVDHIAVRRTDPLRTGLLVGAVLVGTIALLATLSGEGEPDPTARDKEEEDRSIVPLLIIRP